MALAGGLFPKVWGFLFLWSGGACWRISGGGWTEVGPVVMALSCLHLPYYKTLNEYQKVAAEDPEDC